MGEKQKTQRVAKTNYHHGIIANNNATQRNATQRNATQRNATHLARTLAEKMLALQREPLLQTRVARPHKQLGLQVSLHGSKAEVGAPNYCQRRSSSCCYCLCSSSSCCGSSSRVLALWLALWFHHRVAAANVVVGIVVAGFHPNAFRVVRPFWPLVLANFAGRAGRFDFLQEPRKVLVVPVHNNKPNA